MTTIDIDIPTVTDSESAFHAAAAISSVLARNSVVSERDGKPPRDEIALLRKSGLLRYLVPQRHGGPGGTWPDALRITRTIAGGNGSVGQLLGYHYLNSITPRVVGTAEQADAAEAGTAAHNWFFADSVNPLDPDLAVTRNGGGFVLSGRKTFSTGAFVADRILLAFVSDGLLAFALVPADRKGLRANDDFDFIGLRQSVSGTVDFDSVEVYPEEILGTGLVDPARQTPAANLLTPLIQAVFSNVYLGIAEAALSTAADYTRTQSRPWFKSGLRKATDDPHVKLRYGEFVSSLDAAVALAEKVAREQQAGLAKGEALTADERAAIAIATYKSKVVSTKVALEVTSGIFELTGARSTARKFGFDRFWRDVRTHTLHDPVAYKAEEVGAYFLEGEHPLPTFYS
ncbi:MAG: acyl-CoA dehydrogenase family protein [Pseudaminobacter sp.]